ncbi:family 20 glycosylhydrolase [uncultured Clostridium sp.]|uniref:family 20 glycosylhydrolase n=1 Tax=uncultured Clostridium sp. TaxID=59620 RepID=UPI00262B94CF|nr:family 20 glycosylhydrolase [uncultured Clostridium sp.]
MRKIRVLFLGLIFISLFSFKAYGSDELGIIPKPLECEKGVGEFIVNEETSIYVQGKNKEETDELYNIGVLLQEKIYKGTGYNLNIIKWAKPSSGSIFLTTLDGRIGLGYEGYNLKVLEDSVHINGLKPEGVYRGIQTLIQLLPPEIEGIKESKNIKWNIPVLSIMDKPEYEYRGFMIDVARHFFSVEEIKRQIDIASSYKINKLHLHLSDDRGFRLQIKKWPKLASIGGQTEVGGGKGGYYTQEQFRDIVLYAKERYVEIIPEFDMPGHTNAMLASYEFLNPNGRRKESYTGTKVGFSSLMCRSEATYTIIEDIIKEVAEISPSKYIHIGGDEANATSKEDYSYFIDRVSKIVLKYGKIPIGWDPVDTVTQLKTPIILQNWKDSNEDAKKKGMKMIISRANKAYLDMKYDRETPYGTEWAGYNSIENAYNWDPTDFGPKTLLLGLEAPLWTETITNFEELDYMIYPRLLGYAEIGWTPKEMRSFGEYKKRLEIHKRRLDLKGVNYYKG